MDVLLQDFGTLYIFFTLLKGLCSYNGFLGNPIMDNLASFHVSSFCVASSRLRAFLFSLDSALFFMKYQASDLIWVC